MNRDIVLVYGIWRTGTNLLLSMFRNREYIDLNEFFSLLSDTPEKIEILNGKLFDILCQEHLQKSTTKIMLHQVNYLEERNHKFFTRRFLVYRRDIFASIISKLIAEARLNWYRSTYVPNQPPFNDSIPKEIFLETAEEIMFILKTFIKSGYQKITVDHVINYEDDLVPYANRNPTDSLPSSNYTVTNIEELKELFEYSYSAEIKLINDFFDRIKRETNKIKFEELFD